MGWRPIQVGGIAKEAPQQTLFSDITLDLKDSPQLLKPNQALQITNYLMTPDGGLQKRGGLDEIFTVAGVHPITMLFEYTENIWLFGYNTTVAAYDVLSETVTNIKTNFTTSDPFTGVRYGDYAFVCNKSEVMGRISRTLAYDTQTHNFTAGLVVTGATSGASGVILQDVDAGATGTLTLGNVQLGPTGLSFVDNEIIADTAGTPGSATANGTLTWTYTSVSGAPICSVLATAAGRLFAGNLSDDSAGVKYSDQDVGTNPPFSNWTAGVNGTDPGKVFYRNAGAVRAINFLGDNIVVLADEGKWAFTIVINNTSGSSLKEDIFVLQRRDMGGCRASIVTPKGMFYANKGGFWRIASLGQSNVPFSDQEDDPALNLGSTYFNDVVLDDADITYDARIDSVMLSVGKDSDVNNYIICLNLTTGTISEFTGWNINRFMNINQTIYGASATKTTVYECFRGSDDDGVDIWTYFYQELQTGALESRKKLLGQYMDAFVVPGAILNVSFDIYDVKGNFIQNQLGFDFISDSVLGTGDGFGIASFGLSGYGGAEGEAGVSEYFGGARGFISNYQRLRVKISGHDKYPHKLVWIKVLTKEKIQIRRRTMVQTTI